MFLTLAASINNIGSGCDESSSMESQHSEVVGSLASTEELAFKLVGSGVFEPSRYNVSPPLGLLTIMTTCAILRFGLFMLGRNLLGTLRLLFSKSAVTTDAMESVKSSKSAEKMKKKMNAVQDPVAVLKGPFAGRALREMKRL